MYHTEKKEIEFFTGIHQPSNASLFINSFISVNRLWKRKSFFKVQNWILDSGGFGENLNHGRYRHSVDEYVEQIEKWRHCGNFIAAVTMDFFPFVENYQQRTIDNYNEICSKTSAYIVPVLQGETVEDYLNHLEMYSFSFGQFVGVGSLVKKSKAEIKEILAAVKNERPDLKLHAFGLKPRELDKEVCYYLESSDSMGWSFTGRDTGDQNNPLFAKHWTQKNGLELNYCEFCNDEVEIYVYDELHPTCSSCDVLGYDYIRKNELDLDF